MRARLFRLALLLILAALLTPFLKDFIRDVLLLPLLYAAWLARIIFETIPQVAIWIIFLVVALLVALRSLSGGRAVRLDSRETPVRVTGRIESWARLVDQAGQEHYARWRLAREMRKLTLAILASEKQLSQEQVMRALQDNRLDLPPEIRAYLQASMTSFSYFSPTRFWFWQKPTRPSDLDLDPEQVLQFLEERYGI